MYFIDATSGRKILLPIAGDLILDISGNPLQRGEHKNGDWYVYSTSCWSRFDLGIVDGAINNARGALQQYVERKVKDTNNLVSTMDMNKSIRMLLKAFPEDNLQLAKWLPPDVATRGKKLGDKLTSCCATNSFNVHLVDEVLTLLREMEQFCSLLSSKHGNGFEAAAKSRNKLVRLANLASTFVSELQEFKDEPISLGVLELILGGNMQLEFNEDGHMLLTATKLKIPLIVEPLLGASPCMNLNQESPMMTTPPRIVDVAQVAMEVDGYSLWCESTATTQSPDLSYELVQFGYKLEHVNDDQIITLKKDEVVKVLDKWLSESKAHLGVVLLLTEGDWDEGHIAVVSWVQTQKNKKEFLNALRALTLIVIRYNRNDHEVGKDAVKQLTKMCCEFYDCPTKESIESRRSEINQRLTTIVAVNVKIQAPKNQEICIADGKYQHIDVPYFSTGYIRKFILSEGNPGKMKDVTTVHSSRNELGEKLNSDSVGIFIKKK